MAPSIKRRRENTGLATETSVAWALPVDLMLDIIARSGPVTLFRSAAASKHLRREILSPSFIHRVTQETVPCILAYLCTRGDEPLTLVNPATTVAMSFFQDHLRRTIMCKVGSLLGKYEIKTSRRGLVLLLRRNITNRPICSDMCVYDYMSGLRTFLSRPPDMRSIENSNRKYVLLTADDGIGSSFKLLVADIHESSIKVQTASSCGTWEPITYVNNPGLLWNFLKPYSDPAILRGGIIHWLASYRRKEILSYDLGTKKLGIVNLPSTSGNLNQLHLATSSDGERLKLLAIEGFMISVWLQLPVSAPGGSGWLLHTVIDMEQKLLSLDPYITAGPNKYVVFEGSGKMAGDVVLLKARGQRYIDTLFVFDLETNEMLEQKRENYPLLEIDLPSRLKTMKVFP